MSQGHRISVPYSSEILFLRRICFESRMRVFCCLEGQNRISMEFILIPDTDTGLVNKY